MNLQILHLVDLLIVIKLRSLESDLTLMNVLVILMIHVQYIL